MNTRDGQAARLRERRDQIVATLVYVEEQRREVEQNAEWKDANSQRRRRTLLNELSHWYLGAIDQVEKALARVAADEYGICVACNTAFDAEWIDVCPEAELCAACQELRELGGVGSRDADNSGRGPDRT